MAEQARGFEYDVAISFLSMDESFALEIEHLLSPAFSVFVYSKRQEDVAGRESDEVFREVFLKRARVVIVLYRSMWGETPATRIEQTAIRDRAYEEGFDFVLFVVLEDHPTLPGWLPQRKLYYGFPKYGKEGIAGASERLVREAGGIPRHESLDQRAARAARDMAFQAQRKSFLESLAGVSAAYGEFEAMTAGLFSSTEQIVNTNPGLPIQADSRRRTMYGRHCVVLLGAGRSLSVELEVHAANSLRDAKVHACIWAGPADLFGESFYDERPRRVAGKKFEIDVDRGMNVRLRDRGSSDRLLSRPEFIEMCMQWLLDEIVIANQQGR